MLIVQVPISLVPVMPPSRIAGCDDDDWSEKNTKVSYGILNEMMMKILTNL